ncbi:MAG: LacI family DNA-binding transcriptional regulator [Deltaproteobacteria bacterium]|nr:LacI family DNA-binding transcriptional regulator [Candidatus Zymogenaceae bacterium]
MKQEQRGLRQIHMTDEKQKKNGTLEDIARLCNLSISSVSRVLNNEPGVSAPTRRRVLETAQKLQYTPRKRKRPLTRSMLNLAVVVPEERELSENPFFNIPELLGAINEAFMDEKKRVEVVSISDFQAYVDNDIQEIDGIILAYRSVERDVRERFQEQGIPYIFLSRMIEGENYVACNYYKAFVELGKHLTGLGHKRIGYLGNEDNPNNIDRNRGYHTALLEAGIDASDEVVVHLQDIFAVDRACAEYFIEHFCDAVMCFNDYMAIRLIHQLDEMGITVPEGISITGFDDSPLRRVFRPRLTTVKQPTYAMGFLASRWLRDNILNRSHRALRVEVDGKLLIGESVFSRVEGDGL